jgi:transcriptional regulator GlxA family with amidase domain
MPRSLPADPRPTASPPAPRRIALLAFPDAQSLDVIGPIEVFATSARWLESERGASALGYAIELYSSAGAGAMRLSCGVQLLASALPPRAEPAIHTQPPRAEPAIDTLIVAGGIGTRAAASDRALIDWLRATAPRVRRLASVCSGAFLLAQAGLLAGRRATTHWASCADLARRFPDVRVDPDPIFVRDGNVYTSAGVTAGMDLALALVEEDHGREVALAVARWLVLFLKRPGGQSQFSAQLSAQLASRQPLKELQAWIVENVHADLSVSALAARAGMSPRNFARVFTREIGVTPARFVETARVEAARRQLEEDGGRGVDGIAAACGFGSAETLRRAFLRRLRVSPADYRSRFQATAH